METEVKKIPYLDLKAINEPYEKEIKDAINKVVNSGWYLQGEAVKKFEKSYAPFIGMVVLFAALELKVIKVKHIRETSSFLIAVMPVMFIPAAVGLIDSWHSIASAWLQYIVVTVVSTFVVMAVSGWFTQFVIKRGKEAKK